MKKLLAVGIVVLLVICTIIATKIITPNYKISKEDKITAEKVIDKLLPEYIEVLKIYDLASISTSDQDILYDNDGYEYFVVYNDNYNSIEDLKYATEKVCTSKFSFYYYYRGFESSERPLYQEINGKLCRAVGDITTMIFPDVNTCEILSFTKNQMTFTVRSTQPASDSQRIYFTVLNTSKGWKIDNAYDCD